MVVITICIIECQSLLLFHVPQILMNVNWKHMIVNNNVSTVLDHIIVDVMKDVNYQITKTHAMVINGRMFIRAMTSETQIYSIH